MITDNTFNVILKDGNIWQVYIFFFKKKINFARGPRVIFINLHIKLLISTHLEYIFNIYISVCVFIFASFGDWSYCWCILLYLIYVSSGDWSYCWCILLYLLYISSGDWSYCWCILLYLIYVSSGDWCYCWCILLF